MAGGKILQRMLDMLLWWKIRDPRRRARLGRLIVQLRRERERDAAAPDPSGLVMLEPDALRSLGIGDLVERFKALAIAKDEADGIPQHERLYWQLDHVVRELERRRAEHVLIPLYADPDIRVRAEAADATRTLMPELSRRRLLSVDDPDWSQPASGGPPQGKLQGMTTEQLVDRFIAIALDQDDALLKDKIPRFNRLYGLMTAVEEELKARSGDQRRALLALLNHSNPQARLKAAIATLAAAPDAARRTLQAIVDRNEDPQAVDASGMLRSLDEGRYEPS